MRKPREAKAGTRRARRAVTAAGREARAKGRKTRGAAPRPGPLLLRSTSVAVAEALQAIEECHRRGWTDGLPVVPPTAPAIREMLRAGGLAPEQTLGEFRLRKITAEKVAINAVMAGCLPAYFPVVVAGVRGLLDPAFGLHGVSSSTQSAAIIAVVNGPIASVIGMNAGGNALGPGNRANATIGRAFRLVLMNACGVHPGLLDRGTLGTPGRYTLCFAEDESDVRWLPLHVERGRAPGTSAVTMQAGWGVHQISNHFSRTAEGVLSTLADSMRSLGTSSSLGRGECLVLVGAEHRETIAGDGWDKKAIRQYLQAHARRSVADAKRAGCKPGEVTADDELEMIRFFQEPDHIHVVAVGGPAGRFSAWIPGFSSLRSSRAVTVPIETKF